MIWQIPENSIIYNWSLDWRVPLISSLLYVVAVTFASRRNLREAKSSTSYKVNNNKPKARVAQPWTLFKFGVLAHNILLTLFSAFTLYSVAPILIAGFRYRTFVDAFCDHGGWMYRNGVGFWTWAFYMSKYYELIDTFILLAKGKPSNFLQTFHHAGAIISMWMLVSTRVFGSWVFVSFNSFIHSFMYTYYTLTCLGYQPKWKRLMTYMQLTQFFVGLPMAILYVFVPNCVSCTVHPKNTLALVLGIDGYWSAVVALCFTGSYVAYLIVLFLDFARRTYFSRNSSAKVEASTQKKKSN